MTDRAKLLALAVVGWATGVGITVGARVGRSSAVAPPPRAATDTPAVIASSDSSRSPARGESQGVAVPSTSLPSAGIASGPSDANSAADRPSWAMLEADRIAAIYAAIDPAVKEAFLRHDVAAALLRIGAPYQVRPLALPAREFDRWRAEVGFGPIPMERARSVLERFHRLTDAHPSRLRDAAVRVVAYAWNDGMEVVLGEGAHLGPEWTAETVVEYGIASPLRLIGRQLHAEDRRRLHERCAAAEQQARELLDEAWRLTTTAADGRIASNLIERGVVGLSVADDAHGGVRVFRRGMDAELDAAVAELEELSAWTRQRVESLLRG